MIGTNNCNNINYLDICHLPPEVGPCEGRFPRWFFNTSSSQCELFIYGGCHGNNNQFGTLNECIDLCGELYILVILLYDNYHAYSHNNIIIVLYCSNIMMVNHARTYHKH